MEHDVEDLMDVGGGVRQHDSRKDHFVGGRLGVSVRRAHVEGDGRDRCGFAVEFEIVGADGMRAGPLGKEVVGQGDAGSAGSELHLLAGAGDLQAGNLRKFDIGGGAHTVEGEGGGGRFAEVHQLRLHLEGDIHRGGGKRA